MYLTSGRAARQREQRAAATDLEVVRMTADGQHTARRRLAAEQREREHQTGLGSGSASRPTLRQGALPDSWSASRR